MSALDRAWDNCGACGHYRHTHPRPKDCGTGFVEAGPNVDLAQVRATPLGTSEDPMRRQVGGTHYTSMAIQPMTYAMANGFDALQFTVLKYISRFRNKNGIQDLEKARHALDMLIAYEKGKK